MPINRVVSAVFFLLMLLWLMPCKGDILPVSQVFSGSETVDYQEDSISAPASRAFDHRAVERYRGQPEFQYGRETAPALSDGLARLLRDLLRQLFEPIANTDFTDTGIDILTFILFVAAVLFVLVKFKLMEFKSLLSANRSNRKKPFAAHLVDDIEKPDFDLLIKNAEQNQDFHLATRYLFLKLLQMMQQAGQIHWRPDLTNSDYVQQLKGSELQTPFRKLARFFEYVVYGGFAVSQSQFEKALMRFQDFERQLSVKR